MTASRPASLPGLAGVPSAGRTLVMGVVNVTPDSFSDGGRWLSAEAALERGRQLVAGGADLVDVGGESTRPGALRVDEAAELARVVPVVRALAAEGVAVSVDTMRARVAAAALEAGAVLVNDVSGGRADPDMLAVVAQAGAPFVVMHWRAHSAAMQQADHTRYDDVVAEVRAELGAQVDAALAAGIAADRVVVDPGLGFSKTGAQNWEVLAGLDSFASLGYPLLVAASRKRFLGELLADTDGTLRPADGRDDASAALSTLAAASGAWAVRVHEARPSADAVRVVARLAEEGVPEARAGEWGHLPLAGDRRDLVEDSRSESFRGSSFLVAPQRPRPGGAP
ncbi:dihydropteroate synthase [Aeromicrobium sp.]|uniref:dihydropteroate synthase n=1 Tax=Aeromicrobium sp. TaxID=1871063 RepID=UPI0039E4A969